MKMETIDLCVLAYDGPITRAYLAYMKAAGFAPRKIFDLSIRGTASLEKGLSTFLGQNAVDRLKAQYKRLEASSMRPLVTSLKKFLTQRAVNKLSDRIGLRKDSERGDIALCKAMLAVGDNLIPPYFGAINYSDYSAAVQKVNLNSFNDPKLLSILSGETSKTFLFTGGGIVGSQFFTDIDMKMLHVHPGIVPEVRGADGLLWSLALRGRPGYSCFLMDSGIDTGRVIAKREFEKISFREETLPTNLDQLYRGILDFLDPVFRARLLVEVITTVDGDLSNIVNKARPQEGFGRQYFFMHNELRETTIKNQILIHDDETNV